MTRRSAHSLYLMHSYHFGRESAALDDVSGRTNEHAKKIVKAIHDTTYKAMRQLIAEVEAERGEPVAMRMEAMGRAENKRGYQDERDMQDAHTQGMADVAKLHMAMGRNQ